LASGDGKGIGGKLVREALGDREIGTSTRDGAVEPLLLEFLEGIRLSNSSSLLLLSISTFVFCEIGLLTPISGSHKNEVAVGALSLVFVVLPPLTNATSSESLVGNAQTSLD
jgi:hypothetical protein